MRKLDDLSQWELVGMVKTYQGKLSQMVNLLDLDGNSFKRAFEETFKKEIKWRRDKHDRMMEFKKENEKEIQKVILNIMESIDNRKKDEEIEGN